MILNIALVVCLHIIFSSLSIFLYFQVYFPMLLKCKLVLTEWLGNANHFRYQKTSTDILNTCLKLERSKTPPWSVCLRRREPCI